MPRVSFTENLKAHVGCPPLEVDASTLRDALERYFAVHPKVRAYVLDEQDALRKHVTVFVDGAAVADRARLATPVRAESAIYVMQALSGG